MSQFKSLQLFIFLNLHFMEVIFKIFDYKKRIDNLCPIVRLIRFNKYTDSVSLRFKNSDQDWLPEYKQVDRGPKRLYYSQIASGRRLFILCAWLVTARLPKIRGRKMSRILPFLCRLHPSCRPDSPAECDSRNLELRIVFAGWAGRWGHNRPSSNPRQTAACKYL